MVFTRPPVLFLGYQGCFKGYTALVVEILPTKLRTTGGIDGLSLDLFLDSSDMARPNLLAV